MQSQGGIFKRGGVDAGFFRQFTDAADAIHLSAVLATPYRQGSAPVPLAGECPVDVVLQPVPEAAMFKVLRIPVQFFIIGDELFFNRGCTDVPGLLGIIQ